MDLAHQHIASKLNRIAEDKRRMDQIERASIPLFFLVCITVSGVVFGMGVEEYADRKNHASARNEKAFAACMMGKSIKADGRIFWCKEQNYKLIGK